MVPDMRLTRIPSPPLPPTPFEPDGLGEDNGMSTVSNVNGMGDNTFPAGTSTGSGLTGGARFMRYKDYVKRRGVRRKKKE